MLQDYITAHMWFNLAAAQGGKTQGRKNASTARDIVAAKMTSAGVSKAQKLAREWAAKHPKK